MKKTFILFAACAVLAACNEAASPVPSQDTDVVTAVIEKEAITKTYMDAQNNIRWSEGDQIIGFMKTSLGLKYRILSSSVGKTSASFENVSESDGNVNAGIEWNHNVFFYPYSETIEAAKSGDHYALDIVLPSEQTYVPESFGNGSMAMVAVSENKNITFRNVLGGMKLQLKGTQKITSINLQGKNSEKLSGAATVTAYTDEAKPAITMSSGASTSVSLSCGEGVQLSESQATEFIIALPPVAFSGGFKVTVTDSDGKTYTVETDKANTVLRSSLLTMPAFNLGSNPSEEQPGEGDDELIVPVSKVELSAESLELYIGDATQLTATVRPKDATDKTVVWSSDNPAVASIDQTGLVTALTSGTAKIIAAAGGKSATCTINVSAKAQATSDYIDEYGINHGQGIEIDGVVWAPVNCGYHATDYKYGKLYQWGRKYGQGYDGSLYNVDGYNIGEYSDASEPSIVSGPVSLAIGQSESNSNKFYYNSSSPYDWATPQDGTLWNSGTEDNPVKTEYDPCPEGWRVPTYAELSALRAHKSSWTTNDSQNGYWFSGSTTYSTSVSSVFFPAAGYRYYYDCDAYYRGYDGYYWSSRPDSYGAYYLYFYRRNVTMSNGYRAYGFSVRCVQVTD